MRGFAIAITVLFCAVVAVHLLGVSAEMHRMDVVDDITSGRFVTFEEADDADNRAVIPWALSVLLMLPLGVLFAWWLVRLTNNLKAMGEGHVKYGPRWAAGGWFVPIWGWFRPLQVVLQAWRVPGQAGGAWPIAIVAWWVAWLGSYALAIVAVVMKQDEVNVDRVRSALGWFMAAHVGMVVAAILAVLVVWLLTLRHESAKKLIGESRPQRRAPANDAPAARREPAGW